MGRIDVETKELSNDWKNEGIMEKSIDVAKKLITKNSMSLEDISKYIGLSLEKVKELAEEVNKK